MPYGEEGAYAAQDKLKGAPKYGSIAQFGDMGGGTGGESSIPDLSGIGGGGGEKPQEKEKYFDYRTGKMVPLDFKSPAKHKTKEDHPHSGGKPPGRAATPFKLRSGNTTPFKMLGSSPAKVLGYGGLGTRTSFMDVFQRTQEEQRMKSLQAKANKMLGIETPDPVAVTGGAGGEGAHTHGAGGDAQGDVEALKTADGPVEGAQEAVA